MIPRVTVSNIDMKLTVTNCIRLSYDTPNDTNFPVIVDSGLDLDFLDVVASEWTDHVKLALDRIQNS